MGLIVAVKTHENIGQNAITQYPHINTVTVRACSAVQVSQSEGIKQGVKRKKLVCGASQKSSKLKGFLLL